MTRLVFDDVNKPEARWDAAFISWESPSKRHGGSSLAFRVEHEYGKFHWQTPTLGRVADENVTSLRPLVVIDPADRDQLDRLADALGYFDMIREGWDDGPRRRRLGDALREFVGSVPTARTAPPVAAEPESPQPRVRIVVTHITHQTSFYPVPPDQGWKVDAAMRCIVIGRGVTRTHVPLDTVLWFELEEIR